MAARAARCAQLDSCELDTIFIRFLEGFTKNAFSLFQPGTAERLKPEVHAVLSLILYYFTVFRNKPTPGQAIESLCISSSAASVELLPVGRRAAFLLFAVGARWAHERLSQLARRQRWSEAPEVFAASVCAASHRLLPFGVACLLNLIAFLRWGAFASLSQRLAGVHAVSRQQHAPIGGAPAPTPSFEFFSRQLLWEHALEFLTFCSTIVDWGYLTSAAAWASRRVTRMIRDALPAALVRAPLAAASSPASEDGTRSCGLCGACPATQPHAASCGHSFCYYCVSSAFLADDSLRCPVCDSPIAEIAWVS